MPTYFYLKHLLYRMLQSLKPTQSPTKAYIKPTCSLHVFAVYPRTNRYCLPGQQLLSLILVTKFSREFCYYLGTQQCLVRHLAENSLENFTTSFMEKYCEYINKYVFARQEVAFCALKSYFWDVEKLLFGRIYVGFMQAFVVLYVGLKIHKTFYICGFRAFLCRHVGYIAKIISKM